jgi:hypothetical protein
MNDTQLSAETIEDLNRAAREERELRRGWGMSEESITKEILELNEAIASSWAVMSGIRGAIHHFVPDPIELPRSIPDLHRFAVDYLQRQGISMNRMVRMGIRLKVGVFYRKLIIMLIQPSEGDSGL